MKIIQITITLAYGDGVSNCLLMMKHFLDRYNYNNIIMAKFIDEKIQEEVVQIYDESCLQFEEDDIIIYHFSHGHDLNYYIEKLKNRKILVYQNVTPPSFFRRLHNITYQASLVGEFDAKCTADYYLKCITMSEFSKNNLIDMGWNAEDVGIIPLIQLPKKVLGGSKGVNSTEQVRVLFIGRISPNKKQEDVIQIFDYYNKSINSNSKLTLVGKSIYPIYEDFLRKYVEVKDVKNVEFTGHVSNKELEELYAEADVFLCMSEHEGLCLPLLEAMERQVPIIAYNAAAVPDTLGDAGILVDSKNPEEISKYIERLTRDNEYRQKIIEKQNARLQYFRDYNIEERLQGVIQEVCGITQWTYAEESYAEKYLRSVKICIKSEVLQSAKQIVVYGNGVRGKRFLEVLSDEDKKKVVAICDNGSSMTEYLEIPILKHDVCVEQYPEALYVITPKNGIVEIAYQLRLSGVQNAKIKIYRSEQGDLI